MHHNKLSGSFQFSFRGPENTKQLRQKYNKKWIWIFQSRRFSSTRFKHFPYSIFFLPVLLQKKTTKRFWMTSLSLSTWSKVCSVCFILSSSPVCWHNVWFDVFPALLYSSFQVYMCVYSVIKDQTMTSSCYCQTH